MACCFGQHAICVSYDKPDETKPYQSKKTARRTYSGGQL